MAEALCIASLLLLWMAYRRYRRWRWSREFNRIALEFYGPVIKEHLEERQCLYLWAPEEVVEAPHWMCHECDHKQKESSPCGCCPACDECGGPVHKVGGSDEFAGWAVRTGFKREVSDE